MGVFNVWPGALKRKAHKKPKQSIELSGKKRQPAYLPYPRRKPDGYFDLPATQKSAIICELSSRNGQSGRCEDGRPRSNGAIAARQHRDNVGTASGCVFMPFRIDYSNKNRGHCCCDSTNNWNGRGNGNGDGNGDVSCRLMVTGQKQWPNENWPFFCCSLLQLLLFLPTSTSIFVVNILRQHKGWKHICAGRDSWGGEVVVSRAVRCPVPWDSIAEIFNLLSQHVRSVCD